jgi:amino acid transporter
MIALLTTLNSTINGEPDESIVIATPDGEFLNRDASDYPYKSHLQWLRAAYALFGCMLFVIFNGWRSFLKPFSTPDFLAAYMSIPIFIAIVALYHMKDDIDWRPWRWERRVTMDISTPVCTREKDAEKRKGRLHRANKDVFWCWDNFEALVKFVWTWLQ